MGKRAEYREQSDAGGRRRGGEIEKDAGSRGGGGDTAGGKPLETKRRSIAKSISYRIICIISLLVITFILTGDVIEASSITIIFQTLQTVLYYLHERAWARYAPVGGPGAG